MEKVRVQTEGHRKPVNHTQAKTQSTSTEDPAGENVATTSTEINAKKLDQMLLKRAEDLTSNVQHIHQTGRPKASLGQSKMEISETEEQRAARFFTLHGMKKIGHLLGDELTKEQESAVLDEQESATAALHAKSSLTFW